MTDFSSKYSASKVGETGIPRHHMEVPDGAWVKCKECSHTLYNDQLAENLFVCTYCGCHLAMDFESRIKLLTDEGSFREMDAELVPGDPLEFKDSKPYPVRVAESRAKSGASEAVRGGEAALNGRKFMIGIMDFRFMGGSMGSVVGEKITRLAEAATAGKMPLVLVTASGGARMQEGILSLMQMAKTSGALSRHAEAGLGYVVLLTNPTYGGVTASFATLGDVILAEPGAMIGFAGPRVIMETTKTQLPDNFQTAEFLLEKGLIDRVVERRHQRNVLALLLESFHTPLV